MTPYVSLDIETTSLTPNPNNVLSIALVIDNGGAIEDLPNIRIMFLHTPDRYDDTATAMNPWLFGARAMARGHLKEEKAAGLLGEHNAAKTIRAFENHIVAPDWTAAQDMLGCFLADYGPMEVAGKNVESFDWKFLPEGVKSMFTPIFHDPGSLFKRPGDRFRPSMAECCARAGLPNEVTHDAYDDALQVIKLLRHVNADK